MEKKNLIISSIVLVIATGFIAYQFTREEPVRTNEESEPAREERADLEEVSSTITYDIPGGRTHTIRFGVFLDEEDRVQELDFVDTTDPEHQASVDEFEENLLTRIEGRKLSELESVDKVGTSSLTTQAFNNALEELQAQL